MTDASKPSHIGWTYTESPEEKVARLKARMSCLRLAHQYETEPDDILALANRYALFVDGMTTLPEMQGKEDK